MTTYMKLRDKDATLISFESEKGCISNIRVFEGKEWKLATPFYMQLILLAASTNRLEYFGYIMTKKTCDFEIEVKKSYSAPDSIRTIGGK